jgi:hypothetical protein
MRLIRKHLVKKYEIRGHVSPGFESVREEFEAGFRTGFEFNAQLCVYVGQERVVDLWGKRIPDEVENVYDGDSIQNVFRLFTFYNFLTYFCSNL